MSALAGVTFPVGDFGDELGEEAGLATPGGTVGLEVGVPVSFAPGFSWLSTVEGATFGVEDDFIQELLGDVAEVDLSRYWATVLQTGVRYTLETRPYLDIHASAQVGVGVFKAPGATLTVMQERAEVVTEWVLARGYAFGGGVALADRVELDARYVALINPEIEGEIRFDGEVEALEGSQDVAWFQVAVAVRLW